MCALYGQLMYVHDCSCRPYFLLVVVGLPWFLLFLLLSSLLLLLAALVASPQRPKAATHIVAIEAIEFPHEPCAYCRTEETSQRVPSSEIHDIYIIIYMCECMYVDLLCILDYIFMCKNCVCVHLSPVSPVLSPAKALTALAEIDLGALWPIGRFGQATRQGPQPLIHWIPKMESHEDISSMESWLLMDILPTY